MRPTSPKAGYRVYLPDLPGFGQSEKPADFSYSVGDEARIVVGFLDALDLKQVDLGGWSMGGWIVQLVAAEHPERVRRLMLFDSAGLYVKPDWDTKLFTPRLRGGTGEVRRTADASPAAGAGIRGEGYSSHIAASNAWIIRRAMDSMLTGRDTTDRPSPSPQDAGADCVGRG